MVPNVGSNCLSGTPTEGTWGHFAGLCGPYINTTTSAPLLCVPWQTPQAKNTHGSAQKTKIISIWDRPRVRPQRRGAMGCAPDHRPSSVLRIGTIYGGSDAYCELPFDACHQQGHRVKLRWSPVSSRDLGVQRSSLTFLPWRDAPFIVCSSDRDDLRRPRTLS